MDENKEILPDGTFILNDPVELPEVLDILIVGGGPGGTTAAFRAKEMGLSALVIDFDDVLKRIRDYAKDKLLLPGFGGGDQMKFPKAGDLISLLHFSPIDKDDMCTLWKGFYRENNIPAKIGMELTELNPEDGGIWQAKVWNHNTKSDESFLARHVVIAIGRGVPRRFDIPGKTEGIAYRLSDPDGYVGTPALVIGGGTSAAEAVIAISNSKIKAKDETEVYWSYRGDKMPKVSKALADVFFEAYMGNGNIRYFPKSEPAAIITAEDRQEYISIRTDRKVLPGRPSETSHLEFLKICCIACIGEDIPETFLNTIGIRMATGPGNKKRMIVTPLLETQQPNVYLIGDLLSQAYFETDNFDADPEAYRDIKHRGNVKSAMIDAVKVVEVISQKIAGKEEIHVEMAFVEEEEKAAEEEPFVSKPVDSEGPPKESIEPIREVEEPQAYLIRMLQDNVEENEFPIRLNGITTIGRKECDITLTDDLILSDKHASVSHGPEGYFLRDDGSKNGVFLRVPEGRSLNVEPGNIVRVGKQFLLFRSDNGSYAFSHFDHTGKQKDNYTLADKTIVIGRQAPDITLDSEDRTLSRRHLSISIKEDNIFIKDLKSLNGSFLKVKNAIKLEDCDQFRIGQQVFKFSLKEQEAKADVHYSTIFRSSIIPKEEVPVKGPVPEPKEPPLGEPKVEPAKADEVEAAVVFKDLGKSCPIAQGQTICEIAEQNGVEIDAECHAGVCGSDPVRILSGKENLNEMGDEERESLEDICELDPNEYRLACMARPKGPVEVEIVKG